MSDNVKEWGGAAGGTKKIQTSSNKDKHEHNTSDEQTTIPCKTM